MSRFYLKDRQTGKLDYFNSIKEVVLFLERNIFLKTKMYRNQWIQHVVDLGGGYDDNEGKIFTESLADYFETGIIQKDGRHVRCNIHQAATYYNRPEYGD